MFIYNQVLHQTFLYLKFDLRLYQIFIIKKYSISTIKSLCEEFNFDPKMTKEQKIVIKLMTHWTEAKINQKIKPLDFTTKNQKEKNSITRKNCW